MDLRATGLIRDSERVVPSVTVRFCVITFRVSRKIGRVSMFPARFHVPLIDASRRDLFIKRRILILIFQVSQSPPSVVSPVVVVSSVSLA